jgi:ABC-2 type transport system permease protein
MATLGISSTCYTTLAASVVASRDAGVLRRLLATPLPIWAHLGGHVIATVAVTLVQTAVLAAVAAVKGAPLCAPGMVSATAIAGLLVGAVAVCAIGIAAAHLVSRSILASPRWAPCLCSGWADV